MNAFRCPHLDRLGRELIEAYRQVSDVDIFCLTRDLDCADAVASVHQKMAEHRGSCPLCKQAESDAVRSTRMSPSSISRSVHFR